MLCFPWIGGRACAFAALVALAASALSAQTAPAWWIEREVLIPGATADDYAVANVGQLKFIASKAALEMDATLPPGGAGSAVNGLVFDWKNPPAGAPPADDYAVLNQGQLKYVAKLFYDRMADLDYSGPPLSAGATYPWNEFDTDDDDHYAAVNIGQLKYVFSFVPALISSFPVGDSDVDGLPDAWEVYYWLGLSESAAGDPDSDGVDNLTEYRQGRNPTKGVVEDATGAVGLRVYSPIP
jgi:hypothetical protein